MAVTLDEFTAAYIECAIWSSTDESTPSGGYPMDDNYSADDIHPDTLAQMVADCRDFQETFGEFIAGREEQAGHDFWLTRNGHGAGFWDGDWSDPYVKPEGSEFHPERFGDSLAGRGTVGDYLTAMSKPYGTFGLYVGDDGMIHGG